MVLVVDNYDSFVYNLVQLLGEQGTDVTVCRNDSITIDEVRAMAPSHIVISPGPGHPKDSGVALELIREFHPTIPILGVSLGHQAIAAAFGGHVDRGPRLVHGRTSLIYHYGRGIFDGIPSPFQGTRYHSLVVHEPLPEELEVAAFTAAGEVMAVRHKTSPMVGLQFHPESILTEHGKQLLHNFMTRCRRP